MSDIANNLTHALDQLVGGSARKRGIERNRGIYFPISLDATRFGSALERLAEFIGTPTVLAIKDVHDRHSYSIPHIVALKEVSNSAKHWELIGPTSSVMAIAVNCAGGQKIWQVTVDAFAHADRYDFAVEVERLPDTGFQTVIKIEFEGLSEGLPTSPDAMFNAAFRYVRDMIAAVRANDTQAPPCVSSPTTAG